MDFPKVKGGYILPPPRPIWADPYLGGVYLPPRPPADPKGVPYCRRRRPRGPLPPFNPEIFVSSGASENAPQAKKFAIYCRRDPPRTLTPLSSETVLPPPPNPAEPYPLPSESIRRRRDPPRTLKGLQY